MKTLDLLFMMTIPGLVVLVTIIGLIRMLQSKISGKPMRGSSSGFTIIEETFRPTAQYRIQEEQRKQIQADESEAGEEKDKKE
jgi:hypothetical protein